MKLQNGERHAYLHYLRVMINEISARPVESKTAIIEVAEPEKLKYGVCFVDTNLYEIIISSREGNLADSNSNI